MCIPSHISSNWGSSQWYGGHTAEKCTECRLFSQYPGEAAASPQKQRRIPFIPRMHINNVGRLGFPAALFLECRETGPWYKCCWFTSSSICHIDTGSRLSHCSHWPQLFYLVWPLWSQCQSRMHSLHFDRLWRVHVGRVLISLCRRAYSLRDVTLSCSLSVLPLPNMARTMSMTMNVSQYYSCSLSRNPRTRLRLPNFDFVADISDQCAKRQFSRGFYW